MVDLAGLFKGKKSRGQAQFSPDPDSFEAGNTDVPTLAYTLDGPTLDQLRDFETTQRNHRIITRFAAAGIAFFAATLFMIWIGARTASSEERQLALIGDVLMHTQRLARAAPGALQGQPDSIDEMTESRDEVEQDLGLLSSGDAEDYMAAVSGDIAPFLQTLSDRWRTTFDSATVIAASSKALINAGETARRLNEAAPRLNELIRGVASSKSRSGREDSQIERLQSLAQRVLRSAAQIVGGGSSSTEDLETFNQDVQTEGEIVQSLLTGSEGDNRARLQELQRFFHDTLMATTGSPNPQNLVEARNALIGGEAEPLRLQCVDLAKRFAAQRKGHAAYYTALVLCALLSLGAASGMVRILLRDSRRRAQAAEEGRAEAVRLEEAAKRRNDQNQAAILRLMNELQEVADGNLTVSATVTEDVTGAIADSINYTIEELRALVERINHTAELVNNATNRTRDVGARLLAATEAQAREIRDTGERVLDMATQIGEISTGASDSAKVARASLEAAERGQRAVFNQISGMNEIREHIQETSKRIKRLGESSQEIGEIVELISDITEQTNVLALNAAIQAASAGEAGRGFAVVAEEVQRLADRSAEAAKQIGLLIRAIQTDTQDAVIAMERSTQGVVEGTRLSDAAGSALSEIGRVSTHLSDLIERIAQTTSVQAGSAGTVSRAIAHILDVTDQTTEGTRQSAQAIGQLSTLARELKSSVARFRVS